MYKVLTILPLLLAIFTLPALAQDTEEASGPAMTFEATTIDYGVIEQGSDRVRIFKFENTGTEPLIITKAKGSCGCTVPTYPKEPVLPGETGEIKVEYDTNRVGPFTKTVLGPRVKLLGTALNYIKILFVILSFKFGVVAWGNCWFLLIFFFFLISDV